MNLEQQITSLEISKRLKELGVKQEALFVHTNFMSMNGYRVILDHFSDKSPRSDQKGVDFFSAYTVAELGEMLPRSLDYKCSEIGERILVLSSGKTLFKNGWYVMYSDPHPANKNPIHSFGSENNEADARAKALIYLLENNLLKL